MQATRSERFAGLDLLRGIAALSVLALHLPWPEAAGSPLPRGYLAVDLFFVLSGFVIAHAYSQRLGTAKLFKQYCLARLIRLYPLYLAATLLAGAAMLAYAGFGSGENPNVTAGRVASSLTTAVFFLPTPGRWSIEPATFFPLVFAAWSLSWELLVNLLYGFARTLLRPTVVALMILGGAAGIALAQYLYGEVGGAGWEDAWAGGARALFSYFAGVALFGARQRFRAPAVPALVLAVVLILAFVPNFGGWAYEAGCRAVLFPLMVWLGADSTMGPKVRGAAIFVGFLSYPVYLLQAPFLLGLAPLWVRLERMAPSAAALQPVIYAAVIVLGSWLVARWFDAPVREWLRRQFIPRAPQTGAQSAP